MNRFPFHRSRSDRFIELDVLRGFAIASMISLHFLWDLDYYGIMSLNYGIYQISTVIAPIFFILVGICLVISSERKKAEYLVIHGLRIFLLGMILTAVTSFLLPERPIIFGVLHCIGLSIILCIPFLRFKSYNILFAALVILIGFQMGQYAIENPSVFHLILGLHQANVWNYTIDYFPLFPWFGAILFGISIGNLLYKDNKRRFHLPDISRYKSVTALSWMGQNSLVIYLVHHPIIIGALLLFLTI